MNPLLMILMALARQRQGGANPMGGNVSPQQRQQLTQQNRFHARNNAYNTSPYNRGLGPSEFYSPAIIQLMHQYQQSLYNPGFAGQDTVGGGQVFNGLYRGPNGQNDMEGDPNVGNMNWLRGDGPQNMTQPADQSFRNLGMPGLADQQDQQDQNTTADIGSGSHGKQLRY